MATSVVETMGRNEARTARGLRWLFAIALCCLNLAGAQATMHVDVNTTADEYGTGTGCSFREALYSIAHASAFGGCVIGSGFFVDSITLPPGVYTISRPPVMGNHASGGAFYVSVPIFIGGAGAGKTILDGGLIDRVVDVEPSANGGTVSLYSLSIRNGLTPFNGYNGSYGAGVYASFSGTLSLYDVVISDSGDDSGSASALYVQSAAATVASTTIMRNHAVGVFLSSTAASEFDNVTISGNSAFTYTGGLLVDLANGPLTLNGTTIAYNTGDTGDHFPNNRSGGLRVTSSTVNVRNSIIARNSLGSRTGGADCLGSITSQGYNLIEDASRCGIGGSSVGNLTGVDPNLAPLFDYGTGIPTHLLLPGSAALDAGNPAAPGSGGSACLSSDARGAIRGTTRCDIGAYEFGADFIVNSTLDADDANPGDGQCGSTLPSGACTLRAAIEEAGAGSTFRTIRVPAGFYPLTNPGHSLEFFSANPIALVGDGADRTVIEQTQNEVVTTLQQAVVSMHGLRFSGAPGAIIAAYSQLLLDGMRVSGNSGSLPAILMSECCAANLLMVDSTVDHNIANVGFGGGGLYVGNGSTATILNSTFFGNATAHDGGGIYNHGGTVEMTFTTIAGNTAHASTAGDIGGGGIARGGSGNFYIANSIIADNVDAAGHGPDCAGIIQVTHWTLLRDATGCTIGGMSGEAITSQDPQLSSLAFQGSATPTLGLSATSPAHAVVTDAIDCSDANGLQTLTDQRGTARPTSGYDTGNAYICDLGAFQGVSDVIFADGFD